MFPAQAVGERHDGAVDQQGEAPSFLKAADRDGPNRRLLRGRQGEKQFIVIARAGRGELDGGAGAARRLQRGGTLRDIAGPVLAIARSGLAARARLNGAGDNETGYLSFLEEVVASGKTNAERLLERYHGEWQGDLSHVYEEESF